MNYYNTSDWNIDHEISLVGWGEKLLKNGSTIKYWIGRNSWGSKWGEFGFFKMLRGENYLGIEDNCAWAIP